MKSYQLLILSTALASHLLLTANSATVFQITPAPPKTLQEFKQRNTDLHTNIVGGYPVSPPFKYGEWLVAIMKDDFQFCAGSMFGPNLLVTAAHCSVLGFPLDSLKVVARRHDLRRTSRDENGIEMGVKKITVHPGFSFNTLENDIAVWHLSGGEDLKTSVRLDNGKNSWAGRNCTVIGWGATEEGGEPADVLQEVKVAVVAEDVCKKKLGSRIARSMICAGGIVGKDACQGDSGGPMVVMRFFERPVLVGVVSWGKGCAREGYPGVYTRVSVFRTWLREFLPDTAEDDKDDDTNYVETE